MRWSLPPGTWWAWTGVNRGAGIRCVSADGDKAKGGPDPGREYLPRTAGVGDSPHLRTSGPVCHGFRGAGGDSSPPVREDGPSSQAEQRPTRQRGAGPCAAASGCLSAEGPALGMLRPGPGFGGGVPSPCRLLSANANLRGGPRGEAGAGAPVPSSRTSRSVPQCVSVGGLGSGFPASLRRPRIRQGL